MAKKDEMKDNKKNNFGKELKSELKKVTWPSFKQLANNTYAVIAIVLIVAVIVFVLDVCFENLSNYSVDKLKSLVSSNTEEAGNDLNEESENSTEETNENLDEGNIETSVEDVDASTVEQSESVVNDVTITPTDTNVEVPVSETEVQETSIPEANVSQ